MFCLTQSCSPHLKQHDSAAGIAILFALIALASPRARAQGECGAAQDFMVRAREKITPQFSNSDLGDGLQLLKHANSLCSELGDAWYYRSLFEKKLGHTPQADYALRQAKLFNSEALAQGLDPFNLAAPPPPANAPKNLSAPVKDKWALVVGIERFKDARIPALHFTRADAEGVAAVLTHDGFGRFPKDHVKLLTDADASTANIKANLNFIARHAAPDDLVVIYLAAHGSPRENMTGGVNYIITYDTDPSSVDTIYGTALPMVELDEAVRSRFRAQRVAIFLDTCHSGAAISKSASGFQPRGLLAWNLGMPAPDGSMAVLAAVSAGVSFGAARPPDEQALAASAPSAANIDLMRPGVGRVIITSSAEDQKSYESSTLGGGHGYFTYYLMENLKHNQGLDPIGKIYAALKEQVAQQARKDGRGDQTPMMYQSPQVPEIVIGTAPQSGS